jgi:DNA ligase-1
MFLPKIFKTTSTGSIQQWEIEIEGNKYRTAYGQVNGKLQVSEWTTCQGKNIGRANETTPEEQALAEATALRKKKLEKDYMESVATAGASKFLQPMLAKKFENYEDELEYPVYAQPKLDGIRCENTSEGLVSRNGKAIVSCPHIYNDTDKRHFKVGNVVAFDGELYNHTLKENFNKITSLVKKPKPTKKDLQEAETMIQYWVYDIIMPGKFSERNEYLKTIFLSGVLAPPKSWVLVPTYKVENRQELDKFYEQFLADGYEGMIVRVDNVYENKYSKFLLKRKKFQDEEFPILDIIEGTGNRAGTAGYIITENREGKPFKSNIKGDRNFVRDLLKNKKKYIGKSATIKFFQYTPDGIPRFPYVIKISREDYE